MEDKQYKYFALALAIIGLCLSSCSDQQYIEDRVEELNKRIDKLEIDSEEVIIRANSMTELELVVATIEEKQKQRLSGIARRHAIAEQRIASIDTLIDSKIEKIYALELAAGMYVHSQKPTNDKIDQHIDDVTKKLQSKLSQSSSDDDNVKILERLVDQLLENISVLKEENANLRASLPKNP